MGYYINRTNSGVQLPPRGKLLTMILAGDIYIILGDETPKEWQKNLVCIVDNGTFEGAGYIFDEEEFKRFTWNEDKDGRPKMWCIVKNAAYLSGYSQEKDK